MLTVGLGGRTDSKADVLKAETEFGQAKVHNDVAALDRILADDFTAINQWGYRRGKREVVESFRTLHAPLLVPHRVEVQVSDDVAVVDGIMTASAELPFLFIRTYVKRHGRWQLLSSAQSFAVNEETLEVDPDRLKQ